MVWPRQVLAAGLSGWRDVGHSGVLATVTVIAIPSPVPERDFILSGFLERNSVVGRWALGVTGVGSGRRAKSVAAARALSASRGGPLLRNVRATTLTHTHTSLYLSYYHLMTVKQKQILYRCWLFCLNITDEILKKLTMKK